MKYYSLFFSLFLLQFSTKAQDSLFSHEVHVGMGVSNAGINLCNQIGKTYKFESWSDFYQNYNLSYALNSKKIAVEMGIDHGGIFLGGEHLNVSATISNARLNFKYSLYNRAKNNINILSDLGAQLMTMKIDSAKENSKLLELSGTSLQKNFLTAGLGIEYIYKDKIKNHAGAIYGVRAGYNFYIHENPWTKGAVLKNSEYSNRDLGYFYGCIFVGYRLYQSFNITL